MSKALVAIMIILAGATSTAHSQGASATGGTAQSSTTGGTSQSGTTGGTSQSGMSRPTSSTSQQMIGESGLSRVDDARSRRVGTAPNGTPIGSVGSGPGSPEQPYDAAPRR